MFHPAAIHIGHDEVKSPRRNRGRLGADERALPAALYLRDILRLHDYLRTKGIATWMWGDMLLTPAEFPGMLSRHLHGVDRGYGKPLRDQLPRDIVICDWHYADQQRTFPSLLALQNEGFRVIGATWSDSRTISNFSRYAIEHGAYGMMATLWTTARERDRSAADRILQFSGAQFRKSTPAP